MQLVKDPSLWSDEGVVRVLNDYKELADKGYFADNVLTNQNPAAMQEMVLGGQIAMFLNGTWMPNETKASNPDFKWGAFAYPAALSPPPSAATASSPPIFANLLMQLLPLLLL